MAVVRAAAAAAVEAAVKAEVAAVVVRVEAAIAVAVVRTAAAGRVETARAATAVVGIVSAPVITVLGPVVATHRVGLVTVVETATEIATETEIVIEIGIKIVTVIVTVIGIEIGIVMIASIAAHAFTSPRIMAAMDIAPTLMTGAIRMAYTRAQTTRAGGRAMTRSVHTFTGMALMASLLLSVTEAVIKRLIGMASYVVMKKDSNTTRCTSMVGEAFIDSDS